MEKRRSTHSDMPYTGGGMLEGYLSLDLAAPTSVTGTPTTGSMVVCKRLDNGQLSATERVITITNNDPSLEGVSGAYCRVIRIRFSWVVEWLGCDT